jgi:hypothetical protein
MPVVLANRNIERPGPSACPHQIEHGPNLLEIVSEPDAVPPCTFERVYFGPRR